MKQSDQRFWPYKPQASIVSAIALLVGLLFLVGNFYKELNLPGEKIDTSVILGIFAISLLPVIFAIIDVLIERGGAFEYKNIRIDFAQATNLGMAKVNIPAGLGVRGKAVGDKDTTEIIDRLREATSCDAVIVDLEDGTAWWETRLLVLLAGAVRRHKPEKIVFVCTMNGKGPYFLGWGKSEYLLPCLLEVDPQYKRSLYASRAAARQWELVEPINPTDPSDPGKKPAKPIWISDRLESWKEDMAFSESAGLPNELLAEQYLAVDLGNKFERQDKITEITRVRLIELFGQNIFIEHLELTSPHEEQIAAVFDSKHAYIAVTEMGKYQTLVAKADITNQMLRDILEKKKA